jgi:hypothetical protein
VWLFQCWSNFGLKWINNSAHSRQHSDIYTRNSYLSDRVFSQRPPKQDSHSDFECDGTRTDTNANPDTNTDANTNTVTFAWSNTKRAGFLRGRQRLSFGQWLN